MFSDFSYFYGLLNKKSNIVVRNTIRSNRHYLIAYLIFLLALTPLVISYSKYDLHLLLNAYHSPFADGFFQKITLLGDGLAPFAVGAVLLFVSFRKTLIVLVGGNAAGIIAQFLKRIVFPDIKRPSVFFGDVEGFHFVEGFDLHGSFSFPSGHAATVFALTFCVAAFVRNPTAKTVLLILAALVAYSRVYLSQHFMVDIYAGSAIGVFCGLLTVYLFNRISGQWADRSLRSLISKNR